MSRLSVSTAPAAPLALVVGIALAAGATHGAPPPAPQARRDLARGVTMVKLISVSDRYIYFFAQEGGEGDGGGAVPPMRASKAGGPAERVPGLPARLMDAEFVGSYGDRVFFIANKPDPSVHDIVSVDESGHGRTVLVQNRPDIFHLVVPRGHLCWDESAPDKSSRDPKKMTMFCADMDGSNVHAVWQGPEGMLDPVPWKSDLLLFLPAPQADRPVRKRKGVNERVQPGTYSSVLRVSPAGGTPKVLWKEANQLVRGVVDGDDVYACTDAGLVRFAAIDGETSARYGSYCHSSMTVWHGWRFRFSEGMYDDPLEFVRVDSSDQLRVLLPKTLGMGFVADEQALYACAVTTAPPKCDLTRIDAVSLEARAKQPTK